MSQYIILELHVRVNVLCREIRHVQPALFCGSEKTRWQDQFPPVRSLDLSPIHFTSLDLSPIPQVTSLRSPPVSPSHATRHIASHRVDRRTVTIRLRPSQRHIDQTTTVEAPGREAGDLGVHPILLLQHDVLLAGSSTKTCWS